MIFLLKTIIIAFKNSFLSEGKLPIKNPEINAVRTVIIGCFSNRRLISDSDSTSESISLMIFLLLVGVNIVFASKIMVIENKIVITPLNNAAIGKLTIDLRNKYSAQIKNAKPINIKENAKNMIEIKIPKFISIFETSWGLNPINLKRIFDKLNMVKFFITRAK